ncbi:MAG TPA: pyridoxamine 5'-phosphate oxidase family protein [Casimicrobiaceae bacterium]|nr:pyridoxamine 5'-phosphate oxidase family protein [Casimicrobiaceae bacterium]
MTGDDVSVGSTDAAERRELWKRLADERVAMLSTQDADGTPIARPVMPVRIELEGRVWLFTEIDGDIAGDIRRDPRVQALFVNQQNELYASLTGVAEVLHDPDKAREIWSASAGVWYPNGPDDANLGLVRIDVHRGDYWDMKDGKLVRFFKLAAAAIAGVRPDDIAAHRRFAP